MSDVSASPEPAGYAALLSELKARVRATQVRAARAANTEVARLYWSIGRDILDRQRADGWGARVVDRLSADLRREFPGVRGFSRRNLLYMRSAATAWPVERDFVQQPVAQLPCGAPARRPSRATAVRGHLRRTALSRRLAGRCTAVALRPHGPPACGRPGGSVEASPRRRPADHPVDEPPPRRCELMGGVHERGESLPRRPARAASRGPLPSWLCRSFAVRKDPISRSADTVRRTLPPPPLPRGSEVEAPHSHPGLQVLRLRSEAASRA